MAGGHPRPAGRGRCGRARRGAGRIPCRPHPARRVHADPGRAGHRGAAARLRRSRRTDPHAGPRPERPVDRPLRPASGHVHHLRAGGPAGLPGGHGAGAGAGAARRAIPVPGTRPAAVRRAVLLDSHRGARTRHCESRRAGLAQQDGRRGRHRPVPRRGGRRARPPERVATAPRPDAHLRGHARADLPGRPRARRAAVRVRRPESRQHPGPDLRHRRRVLRHERARPGLPHSDRGGPLRAGHRLGRHRPGVHCRYRLLRARQLRRGAAAARRS